MKRSDISYLDDLRARSDADLGGLCRLVQLIGRQGREFDPRHRPIGNLADDVTSAANGVCSFVGRGFRQIASAIG
jgi:hypothetical protein